HTRFSRDWSSDVCSSDLCPNGIDVYFENVGGEVTRAVAKLLNKGSRVPICGYVSAYNAEDASKVETPFHVFGAMGENKPEHRFRSEERRVGKGWGVRGGR